MAFLIDGNNLLHAMAEVGPELGRAGLCKDLGLLVHRGQRVHVVFDGPAPPGPLARQIAAHGAQVTYAAPRSADEVLERLIAEDTGPRELILVSTDRRIRRAAKHRGATAVRSEDFARRLIELAEQDRRRPHPLEPPEKRAGLAPGQAEEWLRVFGMGRT